MIPMSRAQITRGLKNAVQTLCNETFVAQSLRWRGSASEGNAVALTFDDGPHPEFTKLVLEILARHQAKATFFLVGNCVERFPEIVRAIAAAGHEIGNHTYRHNLVDATAQIAQTGSLLESLGVRTHLYRPPYGKLSPRHLAWTIRHGYSTVMWSYDTMDSLRAEGKQHAPLASIDTIEAGDIVLMHDDNALCLEELESLLTHLEARGLRFVTVSELR